MRFDLHHLREWGVDLEGVSTASDVAHSAALLDDHRTRFSLDLLAQVRLRVGDQLLTAVITRDAIDELRLKRGDMASAIVKATEVMVGREEADSSLRKGSRQY